MRIGILSLQGAFAEHKHKLTELGINNFEIRQKKDIEKHFDGLIIPGGESTVQGKLLRDLELFSPLKKMIQEGLPVFGTCAGLLLLSKTIENDTRLHFATMDISAKRNAYGRQLGSFETEANFLGIGNIPMIFIRAPYISSLSGNTKALATVDGKIVSARQNNQLVTSFHPELTKDLLVHEYFIKMVKQNSE